MRKNLLVAGVVFLAGVGVVGVSTIANQKDVAQRVGCQGSLSAIGTAMHEYHEKHGHFPPSVVMGDDGKPKHSWRVLLLEFLDGETFAAYKMDEPWDGPNNRKLADKMPSSYRCPSDANAKTNKHTNYFVVVGPGTVFPGSKTVKLDDIQNPKGSTILVVEAAGQGVHWMEPKDLDFDTMSFGPNDPTKPSISSHHSNPAICTIDVSKLSVAGLAPEEIRRMLLITPEGK